MSETKPVRLLSPLAPDALLVHRASIREELGRLFEINIAILSLDKTVKMEDLLGKGLTVLLDLPDGSPRHFNGILARISQGQQQGRYMQYSATVYPWLWFLTHTSDSRIFQGKTVPQIVQEVFRGHDFSDFELKLQDTYKPREYCVQYQESDFDFISRLLEEEGIYYYFRHEKDKHTLVLADTRTSHKVFPKYEKIPYVEPDKSAAARIEHINKWAHSQEFRTGAYALNDYDFENPRADNQVKSAASRSHARAKLEYYEPVGTFVHAHDTKDGGKGDPDAAARAEAFVKLRLEERQSEYERATGGGNARGIAVGSLFEFIDHTRPDQNREYLVVSSEMTLFVSGYDAGSQHEEGKDPPVYACTFTAQPSKTPFRPRRITPKMRMNGPQTARVVGPGGEEIWTDKHGRVKVQFHWDRHAAGDDTSSCWMRVSQMNTGKGWGVMHIPRIGQEVVVEFMDGDPDRPFVLGRLYNGENTPPFGFPAGATKSGYMSRSTKGGSADNANEFRFEDKKGEEQVFLHAEKNMDTEVEKDQTLWVGHDRKKVVDNDQYEEIKGNKTIKVHKDHTEDINQNMSLKVKQNEDETIGGDRVINVSGNHTETITGNQGVTVNGNGAWAISGNGSVDIQGQGSISVGKNLTESVSGKLNYSVGDDATFGLGKNANASVTKNLGIKVGEAMTLSVTKDWTVTVDKKHKVTVTDAYGLSAKEITIEAEKKMTLKCGSATITLESSGDITIKGGKINVKGDSDVVMKGSKISQN